MARWIAFAAALGGCEFTARDLDSDPGADGGVIVVRSCKATVPADLRLCIDFEDPSLALRALDGSGQLNDATAREILPASRLAFQVLEQAAQLGAQSSLHIDETPDLDLAAFTIEMWIRPDELPATNAVFGLLDNFGQYTMQFDAQGEVRCAVAGARLVDANDPLARGTWHHVACRYDGSELRAYVDGDVSDCDRGSYGAVPTAPTAGTALGALIAPPTGPVVTFRDRFLGGIDNVRVYNGAIDERRLCAAVGRTGCDTSCPERDDGGGGGGPGPGDGDGGGGD